jgi:hypothetical protein
MFFSRIDSLLFTNKIHLSSLISEYVIPKEGQWTARDEEGTAGADAQLSEGAAGSS